MRFANPEYLYLLILIPLFIVVYIYSNYRRRKRLKEYGDINLLSELMPDVSHYRPDVKFWLALTAAVLLIIVVARPQFGSKMESVTRQGIETVIALDISNSMLAEDIAPNRLEKSKKIISKLIDKFENDPRCRFFVNLWVVADNIRKGAATNAVQIAQKMIEMELI